MIILLEIFGLRIGVVVCLRRCLGSYVKSMISSCDEEMWVAVHGAV